MGNGLRLFFAPAIAGNRGSRATDPALKSLSTSRLAEGDPLPPEDHIAAGSVLALEDLYHAQAPRLLHFFARWADR
jgi:hypothetical protein